MFDQIKMADYMILVIVLKGIKMTDYNTFDYRVGEDKEG